MPQLEVSKNDQKQARRVETNIPQRLDRLPWSRWHMKMVIALGITWLLDGLEVTLAGSLASLLQDKRALGLTGVQVGASATGYLAGAVAGALFFGWLTDRLGRKKLFLITLALYLSATAATAFSWNFTSFLLFRVLTGAGIGGEYAAINSAIDELVPARVRGNVDLVINATFWIGAALGSGGTLLLLNSGAVQPTFAWRLAFGIGAVLGLIILLLRRHVPESPRWLMLRGYEKEANEIVESIEQHVKNEKGDLSAPEGSLKITVRDHTPFADVWRAMLRDQPKRSALGFVLMVGQSFFYNAVFFTYGLVLSQFFKVASERVSLFILPLALSNFVGPLILGRFFDSIGRRRMISGTYALAGLLLIGSAIFFRSGRMGPVGQDLWFCAIFFVASSAASSAYLTVSEVFPLEIRAFAISIFYAIGTLAGGVGAPSLFARLIASGSRAELFWGYLLGAVLMLAGAVVEAIWGVNAERQSLESISKPLQSED
ncbi:MAG TPA: MFS transporter [Bryobacteraceae bacterium]|nr:MFS transporter [Bryobacteraceae bacterium]